MNGHILLLFYGGPKDGCELFVPVHHIKIGYTVEWVAQGRFEHLYRSANKRTADDEYLILDYKGVTEHEPQAFEDEQG